MMKRDRCGRFRSPVQETQLGQQAVVSKRGGRRGRPRSTAGETQARDKGSQGRPEEQLNETGVEIQHTEESLAPSAVVGGAEGGSEESGIGRTVTTAFCRLCHGKFSSRSLRSAFGKIPVIGQGLAKKQKQQVFFTDFQRLVGVPVIQDPVLSQFICKNCHTQFYKCSSILQTFIQRVNVSLAGRVRGNLFSVNSDAENSSYGQLSSKEVPSSVPPGEALDGEEEDSDLSNSSNLIPSSDDEEKTKNGSSDELFEPYPENKVSKKSESKEAKKKTEPKVRKKPGPKPGWKKKIKTESYREELPTIHKCPYQGCTAVYRGADGMKKHIKEHHEEVRERPCPHPGCNKVFMIDRYLQRHVKLIHTEVRNYICDECGQTFKQRKHLSVHQMRHSGAKPLQCEVCGFQCRQRASLKYHMTKHKAEAELDFACDQCGKRFEKAHNLNVHMSMVHPLTQSLDKNKSYGIVQFLPPGDPQGMPETLTEPLIHQGLPTETQARREAGLL
ncbi:UNVERIFIED_CONTAM: hypothetical protein FKN15_046945 [Acipenser sinensis]